MFIFRTLKLGVKSLLLHPLRSMLTVLGILIGVAAVISLTSFGDGLAREGKRQFEDLGAENIIIRSIEPPEDSGGNFRQVSMFGVSRAEFQLLATTIPTVETALPIREMRKEFAYTGNPNVKPVAGRLVGCTPEYQEFTRLFIDRGHFITSREVESNASVCVIAGDLAQLLFPSEDPINKQIFLPENKERYRIVGVLKSRDATAAIGGSLAAQDFSKDVYIPITTMRSRLGDIVQKRSSGSFSMKHFELTQVTLRVKDVKDVRRTSKLVENTLNRDNLGSKRQDIAIIAPYDLIQQAENLRILILLVMSMIAGISMFVGGIGIMNIMLATVTERTREIGIRRALGANRTAIVIQFLVETLVLSVSGGLAGVVLGFLGPWLFRVGRYLTKEMTSPEWYNSLPDSFLLMEPQIVWEWVPGAFFVAVLVGVIFGIYPAIRAAMMDPIEALRHE